jgi:hypothetical protein
MINESDLQHVLGRTAQVIAGVTFNTAIRSPTLRFIIQAGALNCCSRSLMADQKAGGSHIAETVIAVTNAASARTTRT